MNHGIHARFQLDYPGFQLQLDLSLPGRGITALFGHSGCGKTTALRCIAGLERAAGGYLEVNGELWQDDASGFFLPTHRRRLGYVFQEASLFPHLSVRRNLEYGQQRSGTAGRREGWEQAVALLGIGHLLERQPERLSGGERQRVAIARALLTSPCLLLMDEPLAALDIKRKQEILPYLERLRDELAIPILYVSHQPDEVARLADHLVLLDGGRALASGPVRELMARLDLPMALEEDAGAVIEATVGQHDAEYHLTRLDFCGGAIWASRHALILGQRVRLQVYARDVSLALSDQGTSSIVNRLPATVVDMAAANNPAHVLVRLDVGGTPLLARITRRSRDQLGLEAGSRVWAQIKAVALLA
jgi:molybdate transport system ATP-binding protein